MTNKQDESELITTAEAAEILGYADSSSIRRMILDNELPATKRRGGRDWQIRRGDVEALKEAEEDVRRD